MTKRKPPAKHKIQCIVCENWGVPTHSSQNKTNYTCSEYCREFHRSYDRRPDEEIRKEYRSQIKNHKVWASFCLPQPNDC